MKAAIYVTKKQNDGLQDQVGQAFALIDERGWEMARMIHQDDMVDEGKLDEFLLAVKGGEFQAIAVPSLDVFPVPVQDALAALGVELAVYDPEAVERARKGNEVLARQKPRGEAGQPGQGREGKKPDFEKLANEPWKEKLLNAFIKKED